MTSLILALLFTMNVMGENEKPKLIYVGDPMCSWCYGISDELSKTVEYYKDQLELELVMGGLRAGGGEEWNASFKDFLRHHWEDVGIRSGQRFSFALLDREEFDYDTEPACRAVVVASKLAPDKSFRFFQDVQKGFYQRSEDPKEVNFYQSICEDLDMDYSEFSVQFESSQAKQNTIGHFQRSAQLGARSFPTVLLEYKGEMHAIVIGYSTFEKMKERIDALL